MFTDYSLPEIPQNSKSCELSCSAPPRQEEPHNHLQLIMMNLSSFLIWSSVYKVVFLFFFIKISLQTFNMNLCQILPQKLYGYFLLCPPNLNFAPRRLHCKIWINPNWKWSREMSFTLVPIRFIMMRTILRSPKSLFRSGLMRMWVGYGNMPIKECLCHLEMDHACVQVGGNLLFKF